MTENGFPDVESASEEILADYCSGLYYQTDSYLGSGNLLSINKKMLSITCPSEQSMSC